MTRYRFRNIFSCGERRREENLAGINKTRPKSNEIAGKIGFESSWHRKRVERNCRKRGEMGSRVGKPWRVEDDTKLRVGGGMGSREGKPWRIEGEKKLRVGGGMGSRVGSQWRIKGEQSLKRYLVSGSQFPIRIC